MYCPSCGKSIPEKSKYCLDCGKPTSSSPEPCFSDTPPQYISEVGVYRDVPAKRNWQGRVFYGFRFQFSLLDGSLRPTKSDGKVRIWVTKKIYGLFFNRRAYVYGATIQVHEDAFGQGNGSSFMGFVYNVEKAVLEEGQVHRIEVWFETPDGRKLYGTDR